MRILLASAFILHSRPYRETSVLLDVFSKDHGRVSLIAKGVRGNRSKLRALLQPFYPLLLSWQGKTELMTLQGAEPYAAPLQLQKECLLSGFYLNELLVHLLQKLDPHPELYTFYYHTLLELERTILQQKYLRLFEKKLLDELGYGLPLQSPFLADQFYRFYPEEGFIQCEKKTHEKESLFSGRSLLALAAEELDDAEVLQDAKRLMRKALRVLLGSRPLYSRKLFIGVT